MIEYRIDEFEVRKVQKGWVVINTKGDYEKHSHFYYSKKAAIRCAKYAARKIIRNRMSEYMLIACKRISIDEDYIRRIDRRLEKIKIDREKGLKELYINKGVIK